MVAESHNFKGARELEEVKSENGYRFVFY